MNKESEIDIKEEAKEVVKEGAKEETKEEKSPKKAKKEKTIKIKESEHQKLLDEVAEYKDKHLRLYAEFENARKRMERERQEFVKYANEELLLNFLTILDSMELSLSTAKDKHSDAEALIKGLELVLSQVYDLLKRNNVEVIAAKGKPFDHNMHEVLMQEESDEHDENVVLEEFQKGYKFGEKILRTVKVKIATIKTKSEETK
jgi:molecular chaperone GrpE